MADEIRNRPSPVTGIGAARLEAARAVIAAAPREPHALDFVLKGDRFVVAKGFEDDVAAAADRQVIARQHTVLEKLRELAEDIGHRLDNQGRWERLPRQLKRLLDAAEVPAAQLPGRVGRIYDLSASLASFVDYDNDLTADRLATDNPLPPDIRRALRDTVATLAVWVRSFPSARTTDDEAGAFLNRPERFETVRETLPATRMMIETARDIGALSGEDAADALLPVETAESGPRGGVQAEKAGYRSLATGRSFLKAFADAVFALNLGALGSALERQVSLSERIVALALRIPGETALVARTMPGDLRVAVEEGLGRAREIGDGAALPFPASGQLPTFSAVPPGNPPPDFDIAEVMRLILSGKAPPSTWVPFIHELRFMGQLADIAPLGALSALQTLWLNDTQVSDIAPLAGLSALQSLRLRRAKIIDITPLAALSALQFLDLDGTQVSDIMPLAGLSKLQALGLGRTQVSDIAPLAGLSELQSLDLYNTQVSDLGPLAGLSELQSLSLNDTQVSDIAPLAGLSSLKRLWLDDTQVSDIAPLAGLSELQSLDLYNTQVSDLGPLAGLSELQSLDLYNTQVSDLGPLAGLSALQELRLSRTKVSDIAPLAALSALQTLWLNDTQVSDIAPLAGLSSLKRLWLDDTQVSDITPLAGLPALQELRLSWTRVADVSPLAALNSLRRLWISTADDIALAPLANLTTLEITRVS